MREGEISEFPKLLQCLEGRQWEGIRVQVLSVSREVSVCSAGAGTEAGAVPGLCPVVVCPCHLVSLVISFPKLPKPLKSSTSFTPVALPEQELSPPFQPKLIPGQFLKTCLCVSAVLRLHFIFFLPMLFTQSLGYL